MLLDIMLVIPTYLNSIINLLLTQVITLKLVNIFELSYPVAHSNLSMQLYFLKLHITLILSFRPLYYYYIYNI